jgi:hypothetical protein
MPTEKQSRFIKHLLGKKGYYSENWCWLELYSIKEAGRLIDKLLKEKWGEWCREFIANLPAPVEKRRRQTELPLPPPEPLPPDDPSIPPEVTEFKRWASGVYQRGEQNIAQLSALYDEKFGNPFQT